MLTGERVGQFREYDLRILQTLANQASLALWSQRRLLKPSMEIEESSSHLFRLEDILDNLCRKIKEKYGFDYTSVQLVRPEEHIIETVYGTGIAENWSGLSKHYLEEYPGLRDIHTDIVLSMPPRIEMIKGPDDRFNNYIYDKFEHGKLVRIFIPMVVVRDEKGKINQELCEECRLKEIESTKDDIGWHRVLDAEMPDRYNRANINYKIIGTVEAGYLDPEAQITNEQAEKLGKYIARKTQDIYHASSLEPLLETFTRQAMECVGADSASSYFLYDKEQSSYLHECCSGDIGPGFLKSHRPRSNSLGKQTLDTGKPAFIPNPSKQEDDSVLEIFNPRIHDEGIRAMAAFPLFIDEQWQGILYVHFRHLHRFTEDEINWIQLLTTRATTSMRRAILHTQMRDRSRQMSALNLHGQNLADITPEGDLLKEIAWNSRQILGADVVNIYEYIEVEDQFIIPPEIAGRLRNQQQMNTAIVEFNAPRSLLRQNKNVYAKRSKDDKTMCDPKHVRPDDKAPPFVEREKIKSSAGIILRAGEERVGIMFINYRRYKNWSQEEKAVIETVASFAALAIRNSRLFKSSEDGRKKLNLLRRIQTRLVEELDLKKDLDLILDEAKTLFHADSGHIRLYDRDKGKLRIETGVGDYHNFAKKEVGAGEAVSGRLIDDPQPIIVADMEESEFLDQKELEELKVSNPSLYNYRQMEKSFACLPLLDDQGLVGTLTLSGKKKETFTEADRRSLEEYCATAMVAIRNARVYEDAIERIYKLQRIAEASLMMLENYSLKKKMAIILTAITVKGGLEFNRAILFLLSAGSNEDKLICEYAVGPNDEWDAEEIYDSPLWEDLAKTDALLREMVERSLIQEHPEQESRFMKLTNEMMISIDDNSQSLIKAFRKKEKKTVYKMKVSDLEPTDILHKIDVDEFALAPISIGEETIGVLFVDNKFSFRPIDFPDLLLLKLFADQAASAIQGERLFRKALRTRQETLQRTSDTVAHLFRNGLIVISDHIRRTLTNLEGVSLYAEETKSLHIALDKTLNLQKIVSDFKKLSQAEIYEHPNVISGAELMEKLLQVCNENLTQKDVKIVINDCSNLPMVKINLKHMIYDFINFIRDSEKHKSSDLCIDISCELASEDDIRSVHLQSGTPYVKLTYSDNGPGIPDESKDRIFKHFHSTTGGDGIGLTITQKNVKNQGGTIIESGQFGEGVRFEIFLPVWKYKRRY